MSKPSLSLSVIVHTRNSAKTLESCLKSVQFADEIIVVDMKSTDETKSIAKKHAHKFHTTEDVGYVEPARNFGIAQATQPWILILDADEEVSPGLKKSLEQLLSELKISTESNAYYIPRKNLIFGQAMMHTGWWPDFQLRLFKKGSVTWKNEIHSIPDIDGESVYLPADADSAIIHHNYQSVEQFVDRMNHYTSIMAKDKKKLNSAAPSNFMDAFGEEFLRRVFTWEGLKDGSLGLALATLQSTSEMLVQLKLWEQTKFADANASERATLQAVEKFNSSLKYWIADWHVRHSSGFTKLIWVLRRKLRR